MALILTHTITLTGSAPAWLKKTGQRAKINATGNVNLAFDTDLDEPDKALFFYQDNAGNKSLVINNQSVLVNPAANSCTLIGLSWDGTTLKILSDYVVPTTTTPTPTTLAPPDVTGDNTAKTLTATHPSNQQIIYVSVNNAAYTLYTGVINVGNNIRPEGYWKFKAIQNGVESTIANSPAFTVSGASALYQFNDAAQTITPANNSDFNLTLGSPFFIAFTAKQLTSAGQLLIGCSTANKRIYDFNIYTNAQNELQGDFIIIDAGGSNYKYAYWNNFGVNGFDKTAPNYWTFVYGGADDLRIYVNGAFKTQRQNVGSISSLAPDGIFKIGGISTPSAQNYGFNSKNFQIDDLVFGNIGLTGDQVSGLYGGGAPNPKAQSWYNSNAVAHWEFNQNLQDSRGIHHGTATTPVFV